MEMTEAGAGSSMRSLTRKLLLSLPFWVLALPALPASAQDVPTGSVDQSDANNADSGDIVVTARRREEKLLDVPISISAFGGNALSERNVDTTDKLTQLAPNVQFSSVAPSSGNSASAAIFIRGVGQTDFITSTDPGVGFYLDGVYVARSSGTAISLLDIERVEILRGPQGTLFGRNTIGGAVQVFSKAPSFDGVSGTAAIGAGSDGRQELRGALNLPLSDTLAVRMAGVYRKRDGYVRNIITGKDQANVDTVAGRLSVLWKPTDGVRVSLIGDYTLDKTDGTATVFGGITNNAAFVRIASFIAGCPGMASPAVAVPENTDARCANNQYLGLGPYKVAAERAGRSRTEIFGGSLNVAVDLTDSMTLKSITAYRVTKPFSIRDADNTPLQILETVNQDDVRQFSQEVTLGGTALNGKLNFLAGAYYFSETDDQFYPVYLPSQISAVSGEELRVGGVASNAKIKNTSFAVFTQESLDITDKLSLTAGIRYTRDVKEVTPAQVPSASVFGFTNVGYNVAYPAPLNTTRSVCLGPVRTVTPPAVPCFGSSQFLFNPVLNRRVDSRITPMASLRYKWSPEFTTYISYSQGYKSGGFNTRIIQPVISPNAPNGREFLPDFEPEKVTSYEVGTKVQLGRVFRVSTAAYLAKYNDIHIVVREGVAPVVRNAGKATIKGFEVEGTISPVPALKVDFGIGYTDFGYDSFTAALEAGQSTLAAGALGRVDLTDLQAYTPKWSFSTGVSYRIDMPFGSLTPRVDLSHRSQTFFDAPNTPQIAQSGYEVINASLRFAALDSRWTLTGSVTNLTNKAYRVSGNSSLTAASGYAEVTYAPPRMWTVDLTYSF
jgi:iron complex outermembrane recepter protein